MNLHSFCQTDLILGLLLKSFIKCLNDYFKKFIQVTILLTYLEIICLLAIAVFGVPHGAYDYEFIKTATKERGSNFALMIAAYLTLSLSL